MALIINLILLAFSESGSHQGGILDVNPGLIFWTAITFLLLFLILKKVAWKPILKSLDDREKFISDSLEKAENARKEAERLFEENKANLAKAEEETQKIILQGREYAEKLKDQIIEESKNEAKKIMDAATSEIQRKNQEAMNTLKEQIVEIAVNAAEKIIRENLDKELQKKIVDKYIQELPKN
ncbi:MAG: F0F1 ATP synthase subunit B [Ignavibacteria bacterium]|nr:F0F1 ATP synthase subunit B [Ignavibacteria bacterium]